MATLISLWRIGQDTAAYEAHDLSGKGAEKSGGRWNRPGLPVVYAARSRALACLETIVHLNAGGLPLNRFLVRIDVPAAIWRARKSLPFSKAPVGWSAIPEGKVSLDLGDAWLKSKSAALFEVPSVIVPEESCVLLNPAHPDAAGVTAEKVRAWHYDGRLA